MANTGIMPAVKLVAPRYGLENGATVINHGDTDQTWGAGFEQEQGLCGIRGEFWTWCGAGLSPNTYDSATGTSSGGDNPADITDPARMHELTGNEGESTDRWQWVQPFLVQAEDSCGGTLHAKRPETKQHLLDVLDHLSIKGAERELWTGASDPDSKALSRGYVDVGTNMSPKVAIAVVEEAMAECLPGVQGTIHLTPAMAVAAENLLHEDDDGKLRTFTGSLVVVGAGYAGQTPGGNGKSAVFGTGPVVVHLGPTSMVTEELSQMAQTGANGGFTNEFVLRAERLVAVTFDGCCHVGATVTLS